MDVLVRSDLLDDLEDGNPTQVSTSGRMDTLVTKASLPDLDNELVEAAVNELVEEQDESESIFEATSGKLDRPTSSRLQNVVVSLPKSTLITPRSVFERSEGLEPAEGFTPPAPVASEWEAIQSLLRADPSQKNDDFIEFELDNFSCYVYTERYPFEMRALHDHATRTGGQHFYFDGILRVGDTQHYVQKVRFDQIPLGNYGRNAETGCYEPTVGDQLWVLSKLNERRDKYFGQNVQRKDIYYQLKNPSIEYDRFHQAFLWVADLAKHVVDFSEYQIEHKSNVSIHHFKKDFSRWARKIHKKSPYFLKWYKQRSSDDFRQSIIANEPFIRKEVFGVLKGKLRHLDLFREIAAPFNLYARVGKDPIKKTEIPQTIVTPYIYECFSHMQLGEMLKPIERSVSTEQAIRLSWPENKSKCLAFTRRVNTSVFKEHKAMVDSIKAGDLISTPPDEKGSGTRWMTARPDKKWFGLVQKVHITKKGERRFDVTWLYQPDDTPCCSMKYPWENELFLSNHCTCDQSLQLKISAEEVLNVHSVEWFGSPDTQAEFFVRQTYITEERRFITLAQKHLQCNHKEPATEFAVGDTVLIQPSGEALLEPYELLEYSGRNVRLRRLRRRREFDSDCAPNELVYTDEEAYSSAKSIASRCIIRFYSPGQTVPAPYNRNGTGNAFFITHRLVEGSLQPLGADRPQLRQGFDPSRAEKKLRALDLFCGCGNFGRGLEDGGAVQPKWANDIWETAIHTYMANADPQSVHPFLGSIDDLIKRALEGKFSDSVPRPGEVAVIFGGSPCPGFSLVTMDKSTLAQVKNRSLVASFASCIDFWRPRWGILENVKSIVQSSKNRTEDFFSQLICALVGMGYQAQIILGDAWAHGAPQTRVRAFLYFAAPGVSLPKPPYPSHSNPDNKSAGGLGKMTNGEPYVSRTDKPTAFKYVTAAEATADLPDIYDAQVDTCISFPDHRLSMPTTSGNKSGRKLGDGKNRRTQFLNLPIRPYNVNFSRAYYIVRADGEPDMFEHERDAFPPTRTHRTTRTSKGWGRAHPHKLFGTITTSCHIQDARTGGSSMHWDQPRPLSIMEVRRAQGVPDDEVLCGSPRDQWEMVGNGVARGISSALGLSLREAWKGTLYEEDAATAAADHGQVGMAAAVERTVEQGTVSETPWWSTPDEEDLDGGGDETGLRPVSAFQEGTGVAAVAGYSRGSSRTSGVDLGRFSSATPATTTLTDAMDVASLENNNGVSNGKRPLSVILADELLSSKRPRLVGSPVVEQDALLSPLPDKEDELLKTESGLTIVKLSSADLEDTF